MRLVAELATRYPKILERTAAASSRATAAVVRNRAYPVERSDCHHVIALGASAFRKKQSPGRRNPA
jgi:hypothetical protein